MVKNRKWLAILLSAAMAMSLNTFGVMAGAEETAVLCGDRLRSGCSEDDECISAEQ